MLSQCLEDFWKMAITYVLCPSRIHALAVHQVSFPLRYSWIIMTRYSVNGTVMLQVWIRLSCMMNFWRPLGALLMTEKYLCYIHGQRTQVVRNNFLIYSLPFCYLHYFIQFPPDLLNLSCAWQYYYNIILYELTVLSAVDCDETLDQLCDNKRYTVH